MATLTVDCGSFNKTSYSGVTQYGTLVNFYIPEGATVTDCSVSFTTHASGGDTADRAFSLNGVRAHSGWASAGALNAGLLRGGNNTFRATLKSQTPSGSGGTSCIWSISNITLTITYSVSGGSTPPPVGGGGPVVISPSSIDAGAGSITVTCPAEAGIWHMIDWTFGSQSGSWSHLWEEGGTKSISIPLSWISEMPNATSGILAIRVRRSTTPAMPYSFATDQTTNVTIKVPASVVPSISAFTAALVRNGVPEAIDGYVQGKSKVALAITATGGSYSPIASYKITGGGFAGSAATGTIGPFNMSGDVIFTAKVTDGRGRTATMQVAIEVMPYSPPAFSLPEAWRSSYDGVKNQKGTYVHLKSGAEYSSLEGQNDVTLKGRVFPKGGTAPAWETMTADTELILGGGTLLYTKTYIAQMQVSDLLETRTIEFIIPTKKTGLSILAGLQGAAIGKPAETPGIFESLWPIVAPGIPPNPNLLHNSDFRNPVNQRGASGAISLGSYFYDRWIRNSGTVTVNAGYLTLASGAVVEQRIEGNLLAGLVCTVSFEVGGTIYHGSGAFPASNGTVSVEVDGYPDITLGCATGYMFVLVPATSETSVKRFKCEMGFVSTLHLDPPVDHAVELLKCQRFCLSVAGGGLTIFSGYTFTSATSYRFMIPTPVPMRIVPTTNAVGASIQVYIGSLITLTSIDTLDLSQSGITFATTIPSGASARSSYNGRVQNSFMLFADL